ncbi:MAG TPA: cytochrome c-type biogenesis protein CcmH [Candidatus Binatia bacterium]|jgi:cytochrome c-type biogenesis protein CcmH|nr:cytochrome c-type biogenesis protein CcmH [Candidatus Binatia bacterium]
MFLMITAARIAKVLLYVIPAKPGIQTLFKFLDSCSHSQVRLLALFLSPSPPARGRGKGEGDASRKLSIICTIIFVFLFITYPVLGTSAPDLEDRTREIASELRCVVCQNLSVADSPSEMAQQMRGIVREQLQAGKSPEEIKGFFVSKYGDWVLLKPKTTGFSALLWILPYVVLVVGVIAALWFIRRWTANKKLSERTNPSEVVQPLPSEWIQQAFEQPNLEDSSAKAQLLRERGRLKNELVELDFDFQSGKLSESDYSQLKQEIETKGAAVIKQLSALPPEPIVKKPKEKPGRDQRSAQGATRFRRWQLVGGGIFLMLFGLLLGVMLTKSVRTRSGENDTMTGDFLTGTTPANAEARAALSEGKTAFAHQEFPKAIEAFKKVLAADPNNPEAHSYMGFILVEAGHADGALLAFDKALSQAPNFPMALWGKGLVLYREKKDFAGAREALEKLLNLVPPGEERNEIGKLLAEIPAGGDQRSQPASSAPAAPSSLSPQITGKITVDPKLKASLDPNAALFIIARPAGGAAGPPLAVKKIDRPTFPLDYTLGQENVMMQGTPFTGKINITVRLDKDGNPTTRGAGDMTGEYKKNPAEVGSKNVDILIDLVTQ